MTFTDEIIGIIVTIGISMVTSYVFIREKLLKNELKNEQLKEYIDGNLRLVDSKIIDIQKDLIEFKELNRDTARSLQETTGAIRELKVVLEILKDDLDDIKAIRNRLTKKPSED